MLGWGDTNPNDEFDEVQALAEGIQQEERTHPRLHTGHWRSPYSTRDQAPAVSQMRYVSGLWTTLPWQTLVPDGLPDPAQPARASWQSARALPPLLAWKKVLYPLATLVMVALALPFGYSHNRVGGVSLKIFAGVMLGILFYALNGLFSNLGVINAWPPLASASAPSALFLLGAMGMLWWVERR